MLQKQQPRGLLSPDVLIAVSGNVKVSICYGRTAGSVLTGETSEGAALFTRLPHPRGPNTNAQHNLRLSREEMCLSYKKSDAISLQGNVSL